MDALPDGLDGRQINREPIRIGLLGFDWRFPHEWYGCLAKVLDLSVPREAALQG